MQTAHILKRPVRLPVSSCPRVPILEKQNVTGFSLESGGTFLVRIESTVTSPLLIEFGVDPKIRQVL